MRTALRIFALLLPVAAACTAPTSSGPDAPTGKAVSPLANKKVAHSTQAIALRQPWNDAAARAFAEDAANPPKQVGMMNNGGAQLGVSFPAFKPFAPQVITHGGSTLARPKVVTISWDGEANRDAYEAFGDQLGDSDYWKTAMREYGVGPTVSGPSRHVHIAGPPPATIESSAVEQLVIDNVQNAATTGWPADAESAIYVVYMSPQTKVTDGGQSSCNMYGGYHSDMLLTVAGTQKKSSFAIILNCGYAVDYETQIASHEIAEAASDPLPFSASAYWGFDAQHLAYDVFQSAQDEIGDACEFYETSWYEPSPPFTFPVQRMWSNASAAAGHNPCIPVNGMPYFNATTFADQMDDVNVDLTSAGFAAGPTKGFKVALGESRTFDVGFYSDAPTGSWTLHAISHKNLPIADYNTGEPIANGVVQVVIDQPTGRNGHKAKVTVTPLTAGPFGGEYFELVSGTGVYDATHTLPIFIAQQ